MSASHTKAKTRTTKWVVLSSPSQMAADQTWGAVLQQRAFLSDKCQPIDPPARSAGRPACSAAGWTRA